MNLVRRTIFGAPLWSCAIPVAACALLAGVYGRPFGWVLLLAVGIALIGAVMVAVHHAEAIAHRVGEPYGTLVLALAVTIIEVSLIVALMLSDNAGASALARDTVFATVMIICNGVVGLCLLLGAIRHHVLEFRIEGTTPALAVLTTLAALTLVLPSFTSTTPGPTLSMSQLIFVGVVAFTLYAVFLFVQTVRHREYYVPPEFGSAEANRMPGDEREDSTGAHPPAASVAISLLMLFLSLLAVVGLAKTIAPRIEAAVEAAGVPQAVVGIAIALMVLLPETWAAVRAAMNNRMQSSFNLALGSALATIGLTIPAVVITAIGLGLSLQLGLPSKEITLLALTFLVSTMTMGSGRATVLQGAVHLVLFAVFLFLAIVP